MKSVDLVQSLSIYVLNESGSGQETHLTLWVIDREFNNGLFTKGWAGFLKMKKG